MRLRTLISVRGWLLASACLVLLPRVAAAGGLTLAADLDGDGQRDHVTLNRREPSVLRIWLSATDTIQVIQTRAPVQQLIAADIDGDHLPELVASDSRLRILVWTRKHASFKSYRRRRQRAAPATLTPLSRRSFNDTNNTESSDTDASFAPAPLTLALCPSARAPNLIPSNNAFPDQPAALRFLSAIDPFRPRPPPAPIAL
jgi:hypothetical protein